MGHEFFDLREDQENRKASNGVQARRRRGSGHTPSIGPANGGLLAGTENTDGSDTARAESSWWHSGWIHLRVDFRSHEAGPEDLGFAPADLRFQIQSQEGMKDVVGQEGDQQEALDGVGVVLVDVIGMPAVDQLIETVILDIPPLVAKTDHPLSGDRLGRKGGGPDPIAGL